MEKRPTLFEKDILSGHAARDRTRSDVLKGGLTGGAIGLAGLLLAGLLYLVKFRDAKPEWWWWAVVIVSLLWLILIVVQTVKAVLSPVKSVTCPKCGAGQEPFQAVTESMCKQCHTLLLLGKDPAHQPVWDTCPYCGLQTAVTPDHGPFLCSNCGIVRQPSAGQLPAAAHPCPECSQPVPAGAIYCRSCSAILVHDFSAEAAPGLKYDWNWRVGKDAAGHLVYARALLKNISEVGQASPEEEGIAVVERWLKLLAEALISVEQALQEPALRPAVEALVPEMDLTYEHVLGGELSQVLLVGIDPLGFKKGALFGLTSEPHIPPRRRVEEALGSALQAAGGVGRWADGLLEVTDHTIKDRERVGSTERLEAESKRLTAWRQTTQSKEVTP